MTGFSKISKKQFSIDLGDKCAYEDIVIPKRATKFSAGYDFFAPYAFTLSSGESVKIPTGIRVILPGDKFLLIAPRSGLGFKYRLQLDNTIGIIDADYAFSDNEGHIFIKLTLDAKDSKTLSVKKGEAFAQGIITQYFTTDDDFVEASRNGGFGSTDNT